MYHWITILLLFIRTHGLKSHQCSCYHFHSDSLTRHISEYICYIRNQGDLVSMETVEEWAFIKMQIQNRTTDKFGGNQWYIGLELKHEQWKWSSGQNLTYNKWKPGMSGNQTSTRFAIMTNGTGWLETTNGTLTKGRVCEKKINKEDACAVRWCGSTLFTTTSMTSISTSMSDHDKRINTSHTVTVTSTQSILTLVTTGNGEINNSPKTSGKIVMVVVLTVIMVLFCIVITVLRFRRDSRKKRKEQLRNGQITMEPMRETMEHNDVKIPAATNRVNVTRACAEAPPSTAEYEEIDNIQDSIETRTDIPTEDGYLYATVSDAVTMTTAPEYINTPSNLDINGYISMETVAGYASLNKNVPNNITDNNHVSMETAAGYTSLVKGVHSDDHISIATEAGHTCLNRTLPSNLGSNNFISIESEACYPSLYMNAHSNAVSNNHVSMETVAGYASLNNSVPNNITDNNHVSMETVAGYTSLIKGVHSDDHISIATEAGHTCLNKTLPSNLGNNNFISIESEACYPSLYMNAHSNAVSNNHVSMETVAGYTSLYNSLPDRNDHISKETEPGYASIYKSVPNTVE